MVFGEIDRELHVVERELAARVVDGVPLDRRVHRRGAVLERDDVLQRLHRLLDDATAARGRLVLLGGEAGIGKSTVVRAAAESAARRVTWSGVTVATTSPCRSANPASQRSSRSGPTCTTRPPVTGVLTRPSSRPPHGVPAGAVTSGMCGAAGSGAGVPIDSRSDQAVASDAGDAASRTRAGAMVSAT